MGVPSSMMLPVGSGGDTPHPSSPQPGESERGWGDTGSQWDPSHHLPPNPPHRTPLPNAAHRRRRGPPKSQPMGINVRAERRRDGGNLPRPPLAKKLKLKHIPPLLCQENTDRSQQPEQGWLRAQQRRAEGDRDRPPPFQPPHPTPPLLPLLLFAFYFLRTRPIAVIWLQFVEDGGEWNGGGGGEKGGKGAPQPAALMGGGWRGGEGMGGRGTAQGRRAELHPLRPNVKEGGVGGGWGGMGGGSAPSPTPPHPSAALAGLTAPEPHSGGM